MNFNKLRVFTPLNADQVPVGSKGYFAETLGNLKNAVEMRGETAELTSIRDETHACRFYCAEYKSAWSLFYLVEEPKDELCTRRELARWLAEGKGELSYDADCGVYTDAPYLKDNIDDEVDEKTLIRKWDTKAWYKPTRKYMGIK